MYTVSMEQDRLKEMLVEAKRAVFFGGAGVSTESGIPDFRSADGLYKQKYAYPPEEILSGDFFFAHPQEFYRFYFDKMVYTEARPNGAHRALARMERDGKLAAVVTQNVDGLHQTAGSRNVFELHGSILRNTCTGCGKTFALDEMLAFKPHVPRCACGGLIKPDVVLYGETLPQDVVERATAAIAACDLLIVGGTSLTVYPAAGLIGYAKGKVVLVNKSATPYDRRADLVLRDSVGILDVLYPQ